MVFWRLGLLALMAAVLCQSWSFLEVRRALFVEGNRVVRQAANQVADDPGASVVLVNYGLHGRTVGLEEVAAAIARSDSAYLTSYRPQVVNLDLAGRLDRSWAASRSGPAPLEPGLIADFGAQLALSESKTIVDGTVLSTELNWLLISLVSEDLTVFLYFYHAAGKLVAQEDGYTLGGLFPFRAWSGGVLVRDLRRLAIPPTVEEGDYVVAVGVYDRASGARQPAFDRAAVPFSNNAVPVGRAHLSGAGS